VVTSSATPAASVTIPTQSGTVLSSRGPAVGETG
jgi:hypothetical protein